MSLPCGLWGRALGLCAAAALLLALPGIAPAATVKADFNGDGRSDLAVGVPGEDSGGSDAGVVNVIYGSATGLAAAANQVWSQNSSGIAGGSEPDDSFGGSLAAGDFNGDGRADLAVGVPHEDDGTLSAGAVNVIYGSASGLAAAGNQVFTQDSSGIGGESEPGDRFGDALVAGDFNGDVRADLAVGVPGDRGDGAGAVNVIYASAGGLAAAGNQVWTQDSAGIRDAVEEADHFGFALAAGDYDGDADTDLAVGVPLENNSANYSDTGAVNVIYGSVSGLAAAGNQLWSQNSSGIDGASEPGDQFGFALAAGDFNRDLRADMAFGVPYEDLPNRDFDPGAVNVIYGSASGLAAAGNQVWSQNSSGVVGASENDDKFGSALVAGAFDGRQALAVGTPGEAYPGGTSGINGAGGVNLIYGSTSGLVGAGSQFWSQDSAGIGDAVEAGDRFGSAVVAGDFDGDGHADMAAAVPHESNSGGPDTGAVHVIYGAAGGLAATGNQVWSQDSSGIGGGSESGDHFGEALASK